MGFAGKPQARPAQARPSILSRGASTLGLTSSGKVRRMTRGRRHKKTHSARVPRIYTELMRDMMETNRAMRYSMIANATRSH